MTSHSIPTHEVTFHTSLSPQHAARLFEWRGQLGRAVRPRHAQAIRQLFAGTLLPKLMEQGKVVRTQVAPLELDGYALVLLHERINPITYPFEWSAQGLKDAALLWLELNLNLAPQGLCLVDAHPWNILFDGARPVFVDLGSFVPLAGVDAVSLLEEFRRWFIHPLTLMSAKQHRIARALLKDPAQPISDRELEAVSGRDGAMHRLWQAAQRRVTRHRRRPWVRALHHLRGQVQAIALRHDRSDWSDYYGADFPALDQRQTWTAKQRAVADILQQIAPRLVHDVAGNRGWYAQLAARQGARVICSDVDESCLDAVHAAARRDRSPIAAVHLDLRQPAPPLGWSNERFPGAATRLQADCVMALAVLHHMVFRAMADFPTVLDGLTRLTRRDLVVEFVSPADRYVSQWWTPDYDWYTLDHLRGHAAARFQSVEVVPSFPDGRHLLLCRGRRQTIRQTGNAVD